MEFAEFLAPFDAGTFRTQYYGRQPLHLKRNGAGTGLLPWQRFNDALAITPYWNEESLKVYYRSRAALRENYCDTTDVRPGALAPVNPAKLKALTALGASLVANHLHRVCPEVGTVVAMLEREFSARAFANVYCSFKGVQAFQTHFDLHDVFAVQTEGEKTWRVYESRADAPVNPVPPGEEWEKWLTESRGKLLFEAHMKPGDVLYLPRGQYHDALTGDRASLHVTFGVAPATGLAVFKLLENALAKESDFRAFLPDARAEPDLGERLTKLADRIRAVMTSRAFAIDVLNHQRDLARPPASFDLPAQRAPAWYSVARRAQVLRRDAGFAVAFEGGEIPIGATNPTIDWILKQRLFSVADAPARQPGADRDALAADLERLEKAGVIVRTEMR
jgi:bifunctional lysine-specific demethylase and histidyl-hydroxylase NO66